MNYPRKQHIYYIIFNNNNNRLYYFNSWSNNNIILDEKRYRILEYNVYTYTAVSYHDMTGHD